MIALPRSQGRSRFAYDFRASFCLDALDHALTPISGQAATFTRAATATGLDQAGATQTFAHSQPAFEWADLDGDGIRDTPGLVLSTSDRLFHAYNAANTVARTLFVDMTEKTATGAANGTRIIEIGNSGGAGAYLAISRAAAGYNAVFNNGGGSVTALSPVLAVVSGDWIRLRLTISSGGVLTLAARRNAAAESAGAPTGALALASWNQPRLSTGANYAGANSATQVIYSVRDIPGTQTAAFMAAG